MLFLVIFFVGLIWSQCDSDCYMVVTSLNNQANNVIIGTGVPAGSKICFDGSSGTFTKIVRLNNFTGAEGNPIVVKNCAGAQVFIDVPDNWGMNLGSANYVHVTGTGDPSITYGFRVRAPYSGSYQASCFGVNGISSNFELDHIEAVDCAFAGFSIKQDPICDSNMYDRGVMPNYQNVLMHHLRAADTGGEGYYIGNSFCSGMTVCVGQTRLPHYIQGLRFFSNEASNTGSEAAQFGCCHDDVWVYSNRFEDFGQADDENQNRGLQIGGGTTGHFVGNFLRGGPSTGIINHGEYNVTIANNIVVDTVGAAIASARVGSTATYGYWRVMHNTIYGVADGGGPYEAPISCVGTTGDPVILSVINNLIGKYPNLAEHTYGCTRVFGDHITNDGNVCSEDPAPIMFTNPNGGDFTVQAGSIGHSGTKNVSAFEELSVDFLWNLRDLVAPTAGAIEYGASAAPDGTPGLPPIGTNPPSGVPKSSGSDSTSSAADIRIVF